MKQESAQDHSGITKSTSTNLSVDALLIITTTMLRQEMELITSKFNPPNPERTIKIQIRVLMRTIEDLHHQYLFYL